MGSIPGSGRSTEIENGKLLQCFAWGISRTEESGWLRSMVSERDMTEQPSTQAPYILGL